MENTIENDGKTIGIIAYLTLIGFIIAIVMNSSKKSDYASFHIRQMLGLIILSVLISVLGFVVNIGIIGTVLNLLVLVLWILAFIGAIQGERKLIPVIGASFQDWFKGIK